jgi:hypothetical protein
MIFLPGQFPCSSTTDTTCGTGDDGDAAGMYDGMMFALDRRDEGFDAEWGRRGTQRGGATISISHRHICVGCEQKIIIIFLQAAKE